LVRYIITCCDLLFDDSWTSYGVKLIVAEPGKLIVELAGDFLRFTYIDRFVELSN